MVTEHTVGVEILHETFKYRLEITEHPLCHFTRTESNLSASLVSQHLASFEKSAKCPGFEVDLDLTWTHIISIMTTAITNSCSDLSYFFRKRCTDY